MQQSLLFSLLVASFKYVSSFDVTENSNLVVYWGQNSFGATHPSSSQQQQSLSFYCQDDSIDVFPVAFVDTFFSEGGLPHYDLSNICSSSGDPTFPNTELADCQFLAADIQTCQSKGKIVTISLGGGAAGSGVTFSSDSQAESFAETIWDLFLGGNSVTRPFGSAVLDGVDLDIEGGGTIHYASFINRIKSLAAASGNKKYYISAAPQCPFPDAYLGTVLDAAPFDMVYVQFYNNFCGLNNFPDEWDFSLWDNWAKTVAVNKNVKVYIGAPASSTAAGSGYVDAATLGSIVQQTRAEFTSFGGAMLWDASQAFANNRYDAAIKAFLTDGAPSPSSSSPLPPSSTPTSTLTSTSSTLKPTSPSISSTHKSTSTSISSTHKSTSTSISSTHKSTSTSTSIRSSSSSSSTSHTSSVHPSSTSSPRPTSTAVSTSCAGVPEWSSAVAYQGGSSVVYNGNLWTAKWWSEADIPGGIAGDWTNDGPCSGPTGLENVLATPSATAAASANTLGTIKHSRFFRF